MATYAVTTQATDVLLKVKQIVGDKKSGLLPIIPVSRAAWFSGVKAGKFPQPDVRFGPRTVMWRLSTIQNLLLNGAASANQEEGGRRA